MSGRRGGATKRRKSTHGGNNSQGGNQTGDRDEGIMDRFLRLRTRQGMGSGSGGPRSNQNASLVSGEQTNLNVSFHEEEHQANASQTLGDAVIVGLVNTVQDLKKEVRIAVEDLKREVGSLRSQNEEVVALLRQLNDRGKGNKAMMVKNRLHTKAWMVAKMEFEGNCDHELSKILMDANNYEDDADDSYVKQQIRVMKQCVECLCHHPNNYHGYCDQNLKRRGSKRFQECQHYIRKKADRNNDNFKPPYEHPGYKGENTPWHSSSKLHQKWKANKSIYDEKKETITIDIDEEED